MAPILVGRGSRVWAIPSASLISRPRYCIFLANSNALIRKMPTFLADHVEKNNLQGQLRYTLFVGASSGAETENRWAGLDMIERRSPHQVGKAIAKGINEGRIKFFDKHLSMFPVDLVYVSQVCTNFRRIQTNVTRDFTRKTDRAIN